jgi:hypothetical protein
MGHSFHIVLFAVEGAGFKFILFIMSGIDGVERVIHEKKLKMAHKKEQIKKKAKMRLE